ncbi:glucosidase II beta subunit-like-domain-containing protein [Globomyces pollinis-pini]|nr:glucosidase II beta subunit-like-domain-containing protein [Globomyces pollinis-pini]
MRMLISLWTFLVYPIQCHSTMGISPHDLPLYSTNFDCLDHSNKNAVINDQYCDCLDGSDETDSNACQNGHFYCQNKGHQPYNLKSYKVNDGYCDPECCDGSDEFNSGVICPNTCVEIANQERQKRDLLESERKMGASKRLELITKAKELIQERKDSLNKLKQQLSDRKLKESQLLKLISPLESAYNNLLDSKKDSAFKVIKENFINTTDESKADSANDNSDGPSTDNPTEDNSDTSTSETETEEEKETEEELKLKAELDEAKSNHESALKDLNDLESQITDLENKLSEDNGPDDVFATLRGQCVELNESEYTYKFCFFTGVHQSYTSLGEFSTWSFDAQAMHFDNGNSCWNGPNRSCRVKLVCKAENELLEVSEPNKCEYEMKVGTPAVCDLISINSDQFAHDEL